MKPLPVETAPVDIIETVDEDDQPTPVMPRRPRRNLSQKIRVTDTVADTEESPAAAEAHAVPAQESHETPLPVLADVQDNSSTDSYNDNGRNNNETGLPRRSRRSPRHLRVSGQRRRRYRDERFLAQSPVPLSSAVMSPEMASGKVWISYPVTPVERFESSSVPPLDELEPLAGDTVSSADGYGSRHTGTTLSEPLSPQEGPAPTPHNAALAQQAADDAVPTVIKDEGSTCIMGDVIRCQNRPRW